MKKSIITIAVLVMALFIVACTPEEQKSTINSFEECVQAGYPVMESYPRQCNADGKTFTEKIVIDDPSLEPIVEECDRNQGYVYCPSTDKCQVIFRELCPEYEEYYREPGICTKEYMPVLGKIDLPCVNNVCDPVIIEFSNRCEAESADAYDIIPVNDMELIIDEPTNDYDIKDKFELCREFGGKPLEEHNECEGITEEECTILGGKYNSCASACRHTPDGICTMQCVFVCELYPDEEEKEKHYCTEEEKEMEMCYLIYAPVCGNNGITYGNDCEACASGDIDYYVDGEC
jgi:hypothetical protein